MAEGIPIVCVELAWLCRCRYRVVARLMGLKEVILVFFLVSMGQHLHTGYITKVYQAVILQEHC